MKNFKIRCLLALIPLLLLPGRANAWRSTLYPTNWQAPVDGVVSFESSKMIQDFSYAGYHGGENGMPNAAGPLFDVSQPPYNADKTGGSDTTAAIQSAINAAQAAGGGVVYMPAGNYSIRPQASNNYALLVTAPNIVLRGAGAGQTFLLNTSTSMRSKSIILINGPSAAGLYSTGVASTTITRNLLGPTVEIPVANTNGFAVGQWVVVRADCTDAWITEHGEPDWLGHGAELGGVAYFRKVVAISGTNLTLNAPTRYYLKTRDNARVVRLGTDPLLECGLENFSIGNVQHNGTGFAENDYNISGTAGYDASDSWAINMVRSRDCWIRNIATFQAAGNTTTSHLLSNGILLDESSQITVSGCNFQRSQYGGGGGNGYMYRAQNVNDCLLVDCLSTFTRHGFVLSHMGSSGNVFYRCIDKDTGRQTMDSGGGTQITSGSNSDHHMHFSHANLVDTCTGDNSAFEARYRPYSYTPMHNLTAAHSVFWNAKGIGSAPNYIVATEQSRYGYVIGTRGNRSAVFLPTLGGAKCNPVDHVEGTAQGDTLEPFSLFADQVTRRLGPGPLSFSDWVASYTNLPPSLAGPGNDPDGDHRNNAEEYLFGGNPQQAEATPVFTIRNVPGGRVLEYPLRQRLPAGTSYVIETSQSPTAPTWQPASGVQFTSAGGSGVFTMMSAFIPDDSNPWGFYRLRIVLGP